MTAIDSDTLFESNMHVFANAFTEPLGNTVDFDSNVFFKLCYSARIGFVKTDFKCPYKKKSHRLKSGDLGG